MRALPYLVAVDVGTTRTAASTARTGHDGGIVTSAFGLGRSSDSAPSTIFVADGELLFGEAAERRGLAHPERLVREFKRRIGDDVPIAVGDQRFTPEELYARMVAWVVDAVAEREGYQPSAICVTRPVTWGTYRSGLVATALAREVSSSVELLTEPEAAARHYETTSPLEPGQAIAVYDLGGGTFDAVLLRKEEDGSIRLLAEPAGLPDFGGADFDDLVLRHVLTAAGLSASELARDPAARVALASLRRECVEAKEALSFDAEAVVPVLVRQTGTTVRITRSEFEGMIEAGVERSIDVLEASVEAAGLEPADLQTILLTGGSSRIPRIAQLLSQRFDRPIAIDADPKAIVALGAARELGERRDAAAAATAAARSSDLGGDAAILVPALVVGAVPPPPLESAPRHPGHGAAKRRRFGRVPVTAAIASGALVLAGGIVFATASELGNGAPADPGPQAELMTDWLGLPLLDASDASDAGGASLGAAPEAGAPLAPQADSLRPLKAPTNHSKKASSEKQTTRATTATKSEEARPSRIPAADAPRPEASTSPSSTPADPEPSNPPSDPTPSDPPPDPTPSDPPPDPTPSDPPPDPTPSDPPPDPTPSDPPPDPTPSDPPPDPTPSDPTPDPTPSDPPPDPTPSDPPPDPTPSDPPPDPTPSDPPPDPTPSDPPPDPTPSDPPPDPTPSDTPLPEPTP
jgi:molecular chaperone DnaK